MELNLPKNINLILTKNLLIMKKETNKTVKLQSKYHSSVKNFRGYKLNDNYGEYSLKLTYYDSFRGHRKALKGRVESNVLTVTYEP